MSLKTKSVLVVLTLVLACGGLSGLIPCIAEPVRKLNHILTQNPVSKTISDLAGDSIAIGTRPIADLNLAIARFFSPKFKKLLHFKIANDSQEQFIEKFNAGQHNEDAYLHIIDLVRKYGYVIEQHEIETNDGYILTMYRIPQKQRSRDTHTVFLMHGLLGSSDDWVVSGPENGLAYILANKGYDVWLGNARGNTHSKRHVSLSPAKSKFWDFTWNEIGLHDLPAMIDYVLVATGRSSLKYVGHSQGTTAFFVMCSELPEYNKKIEIMAALSPVAWMANVVSPVVRLLAPAAEIIQGVLTNIGVNEILPNHTLLKPLGPLLCADTAIFQIVCRNLVFLTSGFSLGQMNATTMSIILGHSPAGASVKQFVHYGQGIVSRDFRKFDRGEEENYERYGCLVPPSYNVEKITCPVALFFAEKDWLASVEDVDELQGRLPNVVDSYMIPRRQFNHFDYIWGVDAKELVFKKLLQIMEKF